MLVNEINKLPCTLLVCALYEGNACVNPQALQARRGGKGKAGGSASAVEASEAGDVSRTPEDSVCSAEGPSHYTDGDTQA